MQKKIRPGGKKCVSKQIFLHLMPTQFDLHSFIFFIGIFSFSMSYSNFPIAIIDISIRVCIFASSVFFVVFVVTYVFETICLKGCKNTLVYDYLRIPLFKPILNDTIVKFKWLLLILPQTSILLYHALTLLSNHLRICLPDSISLFLFHELSC